MMHATMVLMICGCAAGTAIGYAGQYRERRIGWVGLATE